MMGAATEKARLPRFSLFLGIESCCEVDELSCCIFYCSRSFKKQGHVARNPTFASRPICNFTQQEETVFGQ